MNFIIKAIIFFNLFVFIIGSIHAERIDTVGCKNIFFLNVNMTLGKGTTMFLSDKNKYLKKDNTYYQDLFFNGWNIKFGMKFRNNLFFETGILADNFHYKILNQPYSYNLGAGGSKVTDYYYLDVKKKYYGLNVCVGYDLLMNKKIHAYFSMSWSYYLGFFSREKTIAYESRGTYLNKIEERLDIGINRDNITSSINGLGGVSYEVNPKCELLFVVKYTRFLNSYGVNGRVLDGESNIRYFHPASLGINIGMNFKLGKK